MKGTTSCLSLELPVAVNSNRTNATVAIHLLANGNVIAGDMFFKDYKLADQQDIIDQLNKAQRMSSTESNWYLVYQAAIEALVSLRGNV